MTVGISSQTYEQLLLEVMPRPIRTEDEYDAYVSHLNEYIDKPHLTDAEEDMFHLIGTLISEYEQLHFQAEMDTLRGIPLIKGLMENRNLRQKDLLSIFKTKSIASDVLNGKRKLTVEHISKLASYFEMPRDLFFEKPVGGISAD